MLLNVITVVDSGIHRENWYVDNGATYHVSVTMRRDLFRDFEYFSESHTVTTADGNAIKAIGKGTIDVDVNGKSDKLVLVYLRNVWYVPQISRNLISLLSTQARQESHGSVSISGDKVYHDG